MLLSLGYSHWSSFGNASQWLTSFYGSSLILFDWDAIHNALCNRLIIQLEDDFVYQRSDAVAATSDYIQWKMYQAKARPKRCKQQRHLVEPEAKSWDVGLSWTQRQEETQAQILFWYVKPSHWIQMHIHNDASLFLVSIVLGWMQCRFWYLHMEQKMFEPRGTLN